MLAYTVCWHYVEYMKSNIHTNTEASAVEVVRALKSIERVSRPERGLGYCNVDPIDLLITINTIAGRVLGNKRKIQND